MKIYKKTILSITFRPALLFSLPIICSLHNINSLLRTEEVSLTYSTRFRIYRLSVNRETEDPKTVVHESTNRVSANLSAKFGFCSKKSSNMLPICCVFIRFIILRFFRSLPETIYNHDSFPTKFHPNISGLYR